LPWQPFFDSLGGRPMKGVEGVEYEVDMSTHDGVMAHFTCIHYMSVWPRYFTKIGSCYQDPMLKICAYFEVYKPLRIWNIRS